MESSLYLVAIVPENYVWKNPQSINPHLEYIYLLLLIGNICSVFIRNFSINSLSHITLHFNDDKCKMVCA